MCHSNNSILAKKNCPECDKFEAQLSKIRDELRDNIPAEVAKITESQLVRLYSPKKEPAVVFFRHGVPLLYDGTINAEEIYHNFEQNKIPAVKELTDDSFEHLTQAATGSTTGDWFILLYVSFFGYKMLSRFIAHTYKLCNYISNVILAITVNVLTVNA